MSGVRTQSAASDAPAGARAVLDASLSEAEWQRLVIDTANRAGWRVHHQIVPFTVRRGRHIALTEEGTEKGFPDLILVHPELQRVVFAELKRQGGKPSAAQENWMAALLYAGQEVYVWRPADYAEVCRVLCAEDH
jgi:hypothetical protein